MAIKNSKTNTPKEQDGKTGQQMAGGYTLYGRPDGPPIKRTRVGIQNF